MKDSLSVKFAVVNGVPYAEFQQGARYNWRHEFPETPAYLIWAGMMLARVFKFVHLGVNKGEAAPLLRGGSRIMCGGN